MRAILADRPRRLAPVVGLSAVLILIRSFVWVFYEQSHFDSDQAIVGLMAKHLAEGRAFPLFFYGQHYMLAVEAWLAAPVFAVVGASVTALKLPLLCINLAIASVLLRILVKQMRLPSWQAFAVAIFFVIPPPLVSARLVEAQGSNVEPLLYALLLWMLRDRPLLFGALAGFAFLHREFAAYAVAAIVLVDLLAGRLGARQRWREYLMAWGMAALVMAIVSLLKVKADLLGPGTSGSVEAPASAWSGLICWPPAELRENVRWLFEENLSTIFNWKPDVLGPEGSIAVPVGHPWLLYVVVGITLLSLGGLARHRKNLGDQWQFGVYLMAIGVQAALAYSVLSCHVRDPGLIRYTLLTLFIPIGLATMFLCVEASSLWRIAMVTLLVVWGSLSVLDNGRYLAAYVHRPPPAPYRELTTYLESRGVQYGRGLYWTAYQLDFLSREHLTISSLDKVRVLEYQRAVDAHAAEAVRLMPIRGGCQSGVPFRLWCLEDFDRALRQP